MYRAALLLAVALPAACECPGTTTITGRVQDSSGQPLADVQVVSRCNNPECPTTVTDAEGRFSLDAHINSDTCEHTGSVELSKAGCASRTEEFPLDGKSGPDDVGTLTMTCSGS